MIELEKENFGVDSAGWRQHVNKKQDIIYLCSPDRDIWEYIDGVAEELVGQQLFSWVAAMRETMKVDKRMPTDNEWNSLAVEKITHVSLFPGYHHINGLFYNLGDYAGWWSASELGGDAWIHGVHYALAGVSRYAYYQAYGFSVRCLKN